MVFRSLFRILIYTLVITRTAAQESAILDAYIQEGLRVNLSLRQEQAEVGKAIQSLRQAKALFYPQVSFAPTYSVAFGGRRLAFPVGDMLNPAYTALNELTGSQDFPTDIPNINELLAPHNFHDTKILFHYSIYNPEIKYNYLIQNSFLSAGEARLNVVSAELVYSITEAYYQYLQALKLSEILTATRLTLAELVRLNTRLAENNVITRDAVFSAEYELSSLDRQRAEAEKNKYVARAYFNFLLNQDLEKEIAVDTLTTGLPVNRADGLGLRELTAEALSGRQELKSLEYTRAAAGYAVELEEKSATRPALYIGGNAGFQGYGYRFKDQGYLIGQLGLRWDLFKGFDRKARVAQAHIQKDILSLKQTETERRIVLEVTQAFYAVRASLQGVKEADAGVGKAKAYFRVTDSRYRNQNVLLVEYIKAVNDLKTAEIQQALARYELLIRMAHLDRVSGRGYR